MRNRRIGFVFQAFPSPRAGTALENVMLPLVYARPGMPGRPRRTRSRRSGSPRVSIISRASSPAEDKQRVAMARALAKDPAVILADEPTGNLDTASGERVLDLLQEAHTRGVTLVVITHDGEVAARAGRRVWIRDGRLQEERIS